MWVPSWRREHADCDAMQYIYTMAEGLFDSTCSEATGMLGLDLTQTRDLEVAMDPLLRDFRHVVGTPVPLFTLARAKRKAVGKPASGYPRGGPRQASISESQHDVDRGSGGYECRARDSNAQRAEEAIGHCSSTHELDGVERAPVQGVICGQRLSTRRHRCQAKVVGEELMAPRESVASRQARPFSALRVLPSSTFSGRPVTLTSQSPSRHIDEPIVELDGGGRRCHGAEMNSLSATKEGHAADVLVVGPWPQAKASELANHFPAPSPGKHVNPPHGKHQDAQVKSPTTPQAAVRDPRHGKFGACRLNTTHRKGKSRCEQSAHAHAARRCNANLHSDLARMHHYHCVDHESPPPRIAVTHPRQHAASSFNFINAGYRASPPPLSGLLYGGRVTCSPRPPDTYRFSKLIDRIPIESPSSPHRVPIESPPRRADG
ncbi:hypothetical protein RJ55_04460 [Drechmeria coniospora]|nr:hypothetical protein RJ55_04460 [Drechmeria coniospora]